jgi:hypothetical protein
MITVDRLYELIRNGEPVYAMCGMFESFTRAIPTSALRCGEPQNYIVSYYTEGADEPRHTQLMHLYENHRQFCEQLVESIKHNPWGMWSFDPDGRDAVLRLLESEIESASDGPPDCRFIHNFRESQQPTISTLPPNQ